MRILKIYLFMLAFSLVMIAVTSAQYTEYNDIFFLDKERGWIAGRIIIPPNPEQGLILITIDGGLNWEKILINGPGYKSLTLFKIFFLNKNIGWVISDWGLYKSTDGGKNWFHQADSLICYNLYDVFFINESIGWLTGYSYVSTDLVTAICKTVDGGDTWNVKVFENMYDPFYKITFIDSLNGWAVGGGLHQSGSYLFHTTDGGETWDRWIIYGYYPLFDAAYINRNNFWAIGYYGSSGTIIYTSDGENWVNQYFSEKPDFSSIDFLDSLNGWASGYEVVRTDDGGKNWHVVNDSINIRALAAIDTAEAWGLTHTASIVHTVDGGQNWQAVVISSIAEARSRPVSFQLFQNYPNPFNSSTTIHFKMFKPEHVILTIYDILGREVETLVNEKKDAGEYKIRWNASSLPSGLYLCWLQTKDFTETRKLILLR